MLRPPRRSKLFPYTTLFRSAGAGTGLLGVALRERGFTSLDALDLSPADRKSTRLNSSHLGISYAVFCLKKKIRNDIAADVTTKIATPNSGILSSAGRLHIDS